ncbi:hypothetical protein S40288_01300 [Stachybotrys chartarum IBT 40288]|nr:hypothetical protein S40288_01300 [Stachybotrys chartarum IBT 40288]
MGDVYRETRVFRDRDRDDDDDDGYRSTTVRRYKVNPSRYDREDRVVEVGDDHRSRYSGRTSGDLLDIERRSQVPERPRSAFEPYGDRTRSVYAEREIIRDDRARVSVYDVRDGDRDWDKRSSRHHHHHHHHDDEIRVEKRSEERYEDPHGHEVERYRKETEYYTQAEPAPAPVIIRQRAPEPQKIIVQEAPPPAPIIVPRENPGVIVVRDKEQEREVIRREPSDEDYYYRHERREVGPYDPHRDREWGAVGRYDRPRHHRDDYGDDEDYYVRRTVVRRERSESPHHKRHLAEGALAGAGITALLSSRRDRDGDFADHRGRKVVAGAALGALGTEALKRAQSAYQDRYADEREDSDRHSLLKKGLGVAAVALAAAGAAKYIQANKVEKEESKRGRSRRRSRHHSGSEYSVSRSRTRSRSRRRSLSTAAKAVLGTAATAGLVKHLRNRSKSQNGRSHSRGSSRSRSRSKSRLRQAAKIGGAAAAAGVATKMWKNSRDRKGSRDRSSSSSSDASRRRRSSRSRSRSMARSHPSDRAADPELGLVEYGDGPLTSEPPYPTDKAYESEAEARRRRRQRRRERERSLSSSGDDNKRSSSRLRNMAAAGAAAVGIKQFKDQRDRKKEEEERERQHSRERRSRDRSSRDADRADRGSRDRRRYDRDVNNIDERDEFYNDRPPRSHSPPTASGGAYYPPYPEAAPPTGPPYTNPANPSVNSFNQTYVPQDYMGYPPPPPGPPMPPTGPAGQPPPPPGPPPGNYRPDYVSDISRSSRSRDRGNEDGASSRATRASTPGPNKREANRETAGLRDTSPAASGKERSKSVVFIPLSPKSSMTMERHKRQQAASEAGPSKLKESSEQEEVEEAEALAGTRPRPRRRRSSDPSSDRPLVRRSGTRNHESGVSDEEEVEVLPDRFDPNGAPVDGRTGQRKWTSRSGDFVRRPQHDGDWDVRGAWQVGGTEAETVERLAKTVTGVLEGRNTWMQLLGGVMSGGLLLPEAEPRPDDRGHGRIEDDEDDRRAKHRRRK